MKSFVCSLCHNGIVGGGLYLDSQSLTYKTNKLTVGKKYRNLVLPMQEIKEISWKWIVFPIATVNMKNGELYKLWSETGLRQWKGRFHRCTVLWHSLCRLNTLAVGNALPQKSSDGCLGIFYLWWMVQDGNCICFPRKVFHCISAKSVFQ